MNTVKEIMQKKSIKTAVDLTFIEHRCCSNEFGYALINQFRKILAEDGPYIIQCDAGKKRTGFASIVLEMLSGTNYNLIVQDYIESYINNNGLSIVSGRGTLERIKEQKINKIIQFISETEKDIPEIDFINSAKLYLLKYGFSEYEVFKLHEILKQ